MPHISIEANLETLQAALGEALVKAGRQLGSARLLAASKMQSHDALEAAIQAGHRLFGENRVQEAKRKWPPLQTRYPDLELHLIGPLQSNKLSDALSLFDVIETLDRPSLARALSAALHEEKEGAPPPSGIASLPRALSPAKPRPLIRTKRLYIQVNTGREPQKAGILPEDASAFIAYCQDELKLPIAGLMCIPPVEDAPRRHFHMLAALAREHGLHELSMGMSGDWLEAIAEGATLIRLGTAIFGGRPPFPSI